MQTEQRYYIKKWISSKKMMKMSEKELIEFLTNNSVEIPFTNYNIENLQELCYEHKLVKSFETRGRKEKTVTKFMLLKMVQKYIAEHNSELEYDTNGFVTITIKKPK